MALFLIETPIPEGSAHAVEALFDRLAGTARAAGGELIEVQAGTDAGVVYAIVEHDNATTLGESIRGDGLQVTDIAPVRLVGADLDDLKAKKAGAQYLVEWDIPPGVTMDQYLNRKRERTPLYANVPETQFLRTYVREDMAKCLCLYDAPDEDAVRRAREAVGAPIDRLTRLG
jgi:hypothetical protein